MNLHATTQGPSNASAAGDSRVTPMMRQFLEIKQSNPDCLLFYRMGDFYELFFEDARIASAALGIALTTRGKHLGEDIPMCGVPVHSADEYLQRLIAQDHRVAVCEQLEDPAEARRRGSKSVVRRDVVRLVTPGTLTEDALLHSQRNNFLAAVARIRADGGVLALAWADISTGEFHVTECDSRELAGVLARIEPGEILLSDALYDDQDLRELWRGQRGAVTPLPAAAFDSRACERRLCEFFAVATTDSFGGLGRAETAAAGAIVIYIDRTQRGGRPPLSFPKREVSAAFMAIDPATRANLEIVSTLSGDRRGSLLGAVDRTVTAGGARELARRVAAPLTDPDAISARHDAVDFLFARSALCQSLRDALRHAPDLARARSRLALGRGGPRDLAAIRDAIQLARRLAEKIGEADDLPEIFAAICDGLRAPDRQLAALLDCALVETPPILRREGGFVRQDYCADLDSARALRDESRKVIASLQARYQDETAIRSLKLRHNNVLGYFVETTAQHGERMLAPPLSQTFFHRQTLANQLRFTTTELSELEGRIATAAERALALENEIFDRLSEAIAAEADALDRCSAGLAELDVHAGFAALAIEGEYVRPLVEDGLSFEIAGARHPVVEQALKTGGGGAFIANDCDLGPPETGACGQILLLTGPNMGGKSTYLRQNALIAILAQAGAFVPARSARIGIVDRLFSRVGAADDLARGRSTFMVEMVETAAILNQAGPRSLVILDEIGRGTATYDGLSIAWASVEHLHEVNRCRALFATHFHELTTLSQSLPRLVNATVRVKEWKGEVIFLHEVAPGAADRSYGVQVARLAGLPTSVVTRAREVLDRLEESDRRTGAAGLIEDLPLFAGHLNRPSPPPATACPAHETLAQELGGIDPDDLTPREALDALYRLRAMLPNP